jgi:hypothetical protein
LVVGLTIVLRGKLFSESSLQLDRDIVDAQQESKRRSISRERRFVERFSARSVATGSHPRSSGANHTGL